MPRRPPTATRVAIPVIAALLALGGVSGPLAAGSGGTLAQQEDAMTRSTAEELLAADRRFAAEVAAAAGSDRTAVWAGWFADDGCQIVPGAVVRGHTAIRELMAPAFADTGYALAWDPDFAEGSPDGGWTSGRYVSTRHGPDGPVRREGRYLTFWKRAADGGWQVAVDTGVPDGD
jgi:ketosteroid isomerase-like protein